jgi:glycosyltransferase involved in cell wall biosynthesis
VTEPPRELAPRPLVRSLTPHEASERLDHAARTDFAIVVPAFDEAPVVPQLIAELRAAFERFGLDGEVILVDDGSRDSTAAAALSAGEGWAALKVLRHKRNLGKTEALLTAAAATDRRWIILFDADLQHLPEEIPRYLERLQEGWDMVAGRKVGRYEKRFVSALYNWLGHKLFRIPVSDMNSMKGFRRDLLDEVRLRHDWHRFLLVLAHEQGNSITEIDVPLHPRRAGVSKYSGRFRIVLGLLDLIAVAFLLRFSRKPLLLFGVSGIVMALSGLGVGAVAFWLRYGPPQQGFRPLLYLVILLETVGFLLIGFGLIAEMVAHLREEVDHLRRAEAKGPEAP